MNANAKNNRPIRIATRGSALALAQAHMVRDQLLLAHPDLSADAISIHPMLTKGDKQQDGHLAQWGYKGLFTKEVEQALLVDEADIAVHSMKDMPSILPDGLVIPTILEREDPRDAFMSERYGSLDALPKGAIFGTSSVRRAAIIKSLRPDLEIVPFRGNVQTRLEKLRSGVADATLLAVAGLKRLGLEEVITQALPADVMLPAVAQGAVGVECRADDESMLTLLDAINHRDTHDAILCERALLLSLDGSCKTPLSGYATLQGDQLHLRAQLTLPDGSSVWKAELTGNVQDADAIGCEVGEILKKDADERCFFMTVLITRPQADALSFAEMLDGRECLIDPMLTIHIPQGIDKALQSVLKPTPQAIIVTSKHALEGFADLSAIADIPCMAVGARTGAWAEKQGMSRVLVTGENVADLIKNIQSHLKPEDGPVVYVSGRDITTDLDEALEGFTVHRIVTYEAEMTTELSQHTIDAFNAGSITAITFFTPRSVAAFMQSVEAANLRHALLPTVAYCLSDKVAQALEPALFTQVKIAKKPTVDAFAKMILK